jgi:methyl-accepting chemotaxis protein
MRQKMSDASTGRRSLSIFTKTFLTMLTVALVPVLILGVRNVVEQKRQTAATVDQEFEQQAKLVATDVSGWIDGNIRLLKHNALLPGVRSSDADQQRPVLHAMINSLPWVFLAYTIDNEGKNIGRSDTEALKNYADRDYFRAVMDGKDVGWQTLIAKTTGKPAVAMAVPYQAKVGVIGALAISSHLSLVTDAVAAARIGRSGFAFLLDEKGRVIAHRGPEFQGKLVDLSQHPAYQATRSEKSARVVFEEGGKEYIAHALVTRLGWVVVVQQEKDEAFAAVNEAVRTAAIAVAIVAVLALLASILLARALTRPILQLTAIADAISRGETSEPVAGANRGDEIGGLARAIERMRASIDLAMRRLKRGTGAAAE